MGNGTSGVENQVEQRILRRVGGELCLDFVNTIEPRHGEHARDILSGYADLVAWGRGAGVFGDDEAQALLRRAALYPDEASAVLTGASRLRQALHGIFSAAAHDLPADTAGLDTFNVALSRALAHTAIVANADGFAWAWRGSQGALDPMLWPVARSAAELLISPRVQRVRECPGPDGCGRLFLDTSKNGSRRWCSMEGCGNRAKARRHYARQRTHLPVSAR